MPSALESSEDVGQDSKPQETACQDQSSQWQSVAESLSNFHFDKARSRSFNCAGTQSPKMTISIPKLEDIESHEAAAAPPTSSLPSSAYSSGTRRHSAGTGRHRWTSLLDSSIVESPRDEQALIIPAIPSGAQRPKDTIATPSSFWGSMTARLTTKRIEQSEQSIVSTTNAAGTSSSTSVTTTTTTMQTTNGDRHGSISSIRETDEPNEDQTSALTKRRTLLGLVREQMRSGSLFGLSAGQESLLAVAPGEFADIDDILENETDVKRLRQTIDDLHKAFRAKSSALSRSLLRIETLRCEVKAERMQQEDTKELLESLRQEIRKLQEKSLKQQDDQMRIFSKEQESRQTKQEQAERESQEKERNHLKRISDLERALCLAHDEVARLSVAGAAAPASSASKPEHVRKVEASPQLCPSIGASPMMRSSSRRQSIYELPPSASGPSSFPRHEVVHAHGHGHGHRRTGAVDLGSSVSTRRHSLLGDGLRLPAAPAQEATGLQSRRGSVYDLRLSGPKQNRCVEAAHSSASSRRASIIEHAANMGGSPMMRMSSSLATPPMTLDEDSQLGQDALPELVRSSSASTKGTSDSDSAGSSPTTPDATTSVIPLTMPPPPSVVVLAAEPTSLDLSELAASLRSGPIDDKSATNSPNLSHYYQQNVPCDE